MVGCWREVLVTLEGGLMVVGCWLTMEGIGWFGSCECWISLESGGGGGIWRTSMNETWKELNMRLVMGSHNR